MLQLRSPSNQIHQADFAATGATVAKVPFVQNGKVFIPVNSADAATVSNHVYQSEVSGADKATGEAWAVSDAIYWDNTAKKFTKTSSGNTLCGTSLGTALSGDTVTPLFLFKGI